MPHGKRLGTKTTAARKTTVARKQGTSAKTLGKALNPRATTQALKEKARANNEANARKLPLKKSGQGSGKGKKR